MADDDVSKENPIMAAYSGSLHDTSRYRQLVTICEKLHRVSMTGLSNYHMSIRGMLDVARSLLGDVTKQRMAAGLEYDPRFADDSVYKDTPPPSEESVHELSATISTLMNTGQSLHGRGKYYEAIQCFDKVIAINPGHAQAWNAKGLAFDRIARQQMALGGDQEREGRLIMEQAIACFTKATGGMAWLAEDD